MDRKTILFNKVQSLFQRIKKQSEGTVNFYAECFSWELSGFNEFLGKLNPIKVFKFFTNHPNASVADFNKKFSL